MSSAAQEMQIYRAKQVFNKIRKSILNWVAKDWKSNRIRFVLELFAWIASIGCSITLALIVPDVPWLIMYPLWFVNTSIFAWASYTRGSFGMLANFMILTAIDAVGFTRILILHFFS